MPGKGSDQNLRERLAVVKDLIAVFKFERLVYLTIIVVSFIALMASAVLLLVGGRTETIHFTLLFGSSGAISYTGARLLRMWSDALHFLLPVIKQGIQNEP